MVREGAPRQPSDTERLRGAVRLLQLAIMLRQRSATVNEIAVAMNVTKRTAYRDLTALQAVPFPVARDEHGRYRVIGPSPLTDGRR